MSLAARLWAASADLAAVAQDHPFVQGLGSGTLPRQAFSSYVAQDALFLDCFARAYALALVRAPDRETLEVFADLITGVRNELRLHASYAREWGADRPTAPLPATSAYTDFLLATAALGGVGQVCAVMTPCMRLYAHLGSRLSATGTGGPYGAWVRTYADQAFANLATSLERQLDRHATDDTVTAANYRRAMELELAFFDAALDAG